MSSFIRIHSVPTKNRLIGLALGSVACLGVFLLIWIVWSERHPKLPLYPNAQEVEIHPAVETATNDGRPKATIYAVSFWTRDPPSAVFAFYDTALAQQGWHLQAVTPAQGHIYTRDVSSTTGQQGLTVWAGRSERPKLYHVELSTGDYNEMRRIHAL